MGRTKQEVNLNQRLSPEVSGIRGNGHYGSRGSKTRRIGSNYFRERVGPPNRFPSCMRRWPPISTLREDQKVILSRGQKPVAFGSCRNITWHKDDKGAVDFTNKEVVSDLHWRVLLEQVVFRSQITVDLGGPGISELKLIIS